MDSRWEAYYRRWLSLPPDVWAHTPAGWVTLHTHLGPNGGRTRLDDWQVYLMDAPSRYQIWAKTRQAGFSWAAALHALAKALLYPGYTAVFVSVNQEEAKNKIRYARQAYDSLSREYRVGRYALVRDSTTELEWANGSRILSLPAKPVRGYARADIVLDEFAHIPRAREVYEGSTAAAVRAEGGRILIGSSPLGRNAFYEIFTDRETYRAYEGHRYVLRWWDSSGLCVDVRQARRAAREEGWEALDDRASVEDRVRRYGTHSLQTEFYSLPLRAFLQEFEARFLDDSASLIPTWAIQEASDPAWTGGYYATMDPLDLREALSGVGRALSLADPAYGVYAGFDVALVRHQSVLTLVAPRVMGGRMRLALVGLVAMRNTPAPPQIDLLMYVLAQPVVRGLWIDSTGLGLPIAQTLSRHWGARVHPVPFTQPEKEFLASRLALLYERGYMYHRYDRSLIGQLTAVRKRPSPSGRMVVVADEGEEHHADMFWALALAVRDIDVDALSPEDDLGILFAPRRNARPYR